MNISPRSSFEEVVHGLYDHGHPVVRDDMELPRFLANTERSYDPLRKNHDGIGFSIRNMREGGPVVTFASTGTAMPPQSLLLQFNGYMQAQTASMTDKVLIPLRPLLGQFGTMGVGYAHGGRGTESVLTRQGRYTVSDIQTDVEYDLSGLNEWMHGMASRSSVSLPGLPVPSLPTVLMGHSQGGQQIAHVLAHPQRYGFTPDQIRGVILMNSMLLPHSQMMLRTPGFMREIALKSLGSVTRSIITGKGLLFRGQKAFDTFLGEGDPNGVNERRVTENTFPDSGMFFAQTVTTGTSPSLKHANLKGLPISMVISEGDQLMAQELQHNTADYLQSLGADVYVRNIPGKHFSPIVTVSGESRERIEMIMRENATAFAHAFQRVV